MYLFKFLATALHNEQLTCLLGSIDCVLDPWSLSSSLLYGSPQAT